MNHVFNVLGDNKIPGQELVESGLHHDQEMTKVLVSLWKSCDRFREGQVYPHYRAATNAHR